MIARTIRTLMLAGACLAAPALAQGPVPVIAVPPLATPTDDAETRSLAWQATQLIATDLRSSPELMTLPPDQKDFYSYPEVTAPSYPKWRGRGVKAVVTGFVQKRPDGRLAVGCYVYDVESRRELGRTGFVVAPEDWRRAAHKCSGLAYEELTGAPGIFDTRIAYVASSGTGTARVKRIAVMDSDGVNHAFVTKGDTIVLTPRLSPIGNRVAFVSFVGGRPHVRVADVASGDDRPLLHPDALTFAPRFSPDGERILFSMTVGGNTDVYVVDAGGGSPRRLTASPGIDTEASFSPDGSRILFESDRSGSQQIYVMDADGSGQRRVSFGGGWYAAPAWSPDGETIAFTRRTLDGLRIGVMKADGTDERLLTNGPRDEGANWAASSRELIFQRTDPAGRTAIYRVALNGAEPRKVVTPQDAGDPGWSGVRE